MLNMWKWNITNVGDRKMQWAVRNYELIKNKDVPVLLFVHGAASKGEHWIKAAEKLMDKYCVIVLNRPGYGKSSGDPCCSIEESADLIIEWIDKIGINRPIFFIGHSLGGAIGLTCTLKYSNYISGLILVATFARFRLNKSFINELNNGIYSLDMIKTGFSNSAPKEIVDQFTNDVVNTDISVIRADFFTTDGWDFRDKVPDIKVPTLILAPKEDKVVTFRQAEYLNKNIENSRLKYILNSGHNVLVEQPEETANEISVFINKIYKV